jgi:hypothetical protein
VATIVVFPESIFQSNSQEFFPMLGIELLKAASAATKAILVHVILPTKNRNFHNPAIALYPGGKIANAS